MFYGSDPPCFKVSGLSLERLTLTKNSAFSVISITLITRFCTVAIPVVMARSSLME